MLYPKVVSSAMALFGVAYAGYVSFGRRSRAKDTWKLVVIGDGVSDLGMMALIYHYTKQGQMWRAVAVPVVVHLLTGLPMIMAQVGKHLVNHKVTDVYWEVYAEQKRLNEMGLGEGEL